MTYYKQISSGTINKVAVFTGNELYNIEHTIRYIEDHFLNPSYSEFNMVKIENTFDLDSFLSVASTMPFFDERRIVLINNTNVLKQIKDQQEADLLDFLKNCPDSLIVIFKESDIDGRKKISKWLKKSTDWVEFSKLTHAEFTKWCRKKFALYGGSIDAKGISYFVERIDYLDSAAEKNLFDVDNTIKSICANVKNIDSAMIDQYVTLPIEHNIFKLMDSVSMNNMSDAITTLNQFINSGEPVIKIFTLIAQQFRNIYKMKLLIEAGYTSTTAASKLEIHPFVAKKAASFATKYTQSQLIRILNIMEETDTALKSTGIRPQLTLEKSLFEIAFI
jgi:DNA polymerase-3 subunit delta